MLEPRAPGAGAIEPIAVGCVGSRDLADEAAAACRQIGAELARGGFTIVTGATPGEPGRDVWANWGCGAFAYGAACVAPAALTVCLPWRHFPRGSGAPAPGITVSYPEDHSEWIAAAAAFWAATHDEGEGAWAEAVPRASRLLRTRNAGIVLRSRLLLAWLEGDDDATRFAMRFAAWHGVPVLDLTQTAWWTVVPALVGQAARLSAGSHPRVTQREE